MAFRRFFFEVIVSHSSPRQTALDILRRVEQGAFSDLALDAALRKHPEMAARDRALVTEMVYGLLRHRGRLDYALRRFCKKPLHTLDQDVLLLLRLGSYQVLQLDRVPDRAAVHETVELAKRNGLGRASGFINGVLRSLVRQKTSIRWPDAKHDPLEHLQHALSLPPWLARRLLQELGAEEAYALGAELLKEPPLTLRVNTLKVTRQAFLDALTEAGIEASATRYAPEGVSVSHSRGGTFPGDEQGWYQVQDEASMLMAHLLSPRSGDCILDACAAPGGKTTHLAALSANDAKIVALDLYPNRVKMVEEGSRRLGCDNIDARCWDMTSEPAFLKAGSFDRVLVDAPCSGLGVLRRNPESRWRRKESDLARLAKLQRTILAQVAPMVRPGGVLLYSLCTVTAEETEGVVDDFLSCHPEFVREDLRDSAPSAWHELFDARGALQTWPHRHGGMDGFYAVRFKKQSPSPDDL